MRFLSLRRRITRREKLVLAPIWRSQIYIDQCRILNMHSSTTNRIGSDISSITLQLSINGWTRLNGLVQETVSSSFQFSLSQLTIPSIAAAASSGDKLSRAEGDMTKTLGSDSSSRKEAMPPPSPPAIIIPRDYLCHKSLGIMS